MPVSAGDIVKASDSPRELDYDEITTSTGEITATADVGPSITFTLAETRIVVVTASAIVTSTLANDTMIVSITDAANALQSYGGTHRLDINGQQIRSEFSVRQSLPAGSYTFKMRAAGSVSAGVTTINASSSNPAWIQAVDLGPA